MYNTKMKTWNPDVCVKIAKYLKLPYRWYDPSTGVCNLKHVALESPSSRRVVIDRMVSAQSEINESQWNILKHWPLTPDQMRNLVFNQNDPSAWAQRMHLSDEDRKAVTDRLSRHTGYLWNAMQGSNPEENAAAVAFFTAMETDLFKYGNTKGVPFTDSKLEGLWVVNNPYFQWHPPGEPLPFPFDAQKLEAHLIEYREHVDKSLRIQNILTTFRQDPTLFGAMVREWMRWRSMRGDTPTTCKENPADIQGKTLPMLIAEFEQTKKPQGEKWVLSQVLRYTSHFNEEQWGAALNYIRKEARDALHTLPLSVCYFAPRERFESLLQIEGFANYVALRIAEQGHAFENEIITKRASVWRWRLDPQGDYETLPLADKIMANAQSSFTASDIVKRHRLLKELHPQWTLPMTYKHIFNEVLQDPMPAVDFLDSSTYST
jgi:hypothetical protein